MSDKMVLVVSRWLAVLLVCVSRASASVITSKLHWNSSNPIFRIDNTDHIIDVNKNNFPYDYDQVNIICPTYDQSTREEDTEKYIIYNVSKEEYDTCRITTLHPRVITVCNKPYDLMYVTITFRPFSPQPNGLEFRPGVDYYFISTSSSDDLERRIGGRCSSHHMKVVFKVCCDPDKPQQGKPLGDEGGVQQHAGLLPGMVSSGAKDGPLNNTKIIPAQQPPPSQHHGGGAGNPQSTTDNKRTTPSTTTTTAIIRPPSAPPMTVARSTNTRLTTPRWRRPSYSDPPRDYGDYPLRKDRPYSVKSNTKKDGQERYPPAPHKPTLQVKNEALNSSSLPAASLMPILLCLTLLLTISAMFNSSSTASSCRTQQLPPSTTYLLLQQEGCHRRRQHRGYRQEKAFAGVYDAVNISASEGASSAQYRTCSSSSPQYYQVVYPSSEGSEVLQGKHSKELDTCRVVLPSPLQQRFTVHSSSKNHSSMSFNGAPQHHLLLHTSCTLPHQTHTSNDRSHFRPPHPPPLPPPLLTSSSSSR